MRRGRDRSGLTMGALSSQRSSNRDQYPCRVDSFSCKQVSKEISAHTQQRLVWLGAMRSEEEMEDLEKELHGDEVDYDLLQAYMMSLGEFRPQNVDNLMRVV